MTTILIILAAIILVVFIAHLLAKKEMNIVKEITIQKPADQVYAYLRLTKNQDYFSTWNMLDPSMKKEYEGTDGQVGFIYRWDSATNKNVGAGEQEIIKMEEGKSIDYKLHFLRPMKNTAYSGFLITATNSQSTTVQWRFYGPTKFPMTILKGVFEKMLGKDLEKGLATLKQVLEN